MRLSRESTGCADGVAVDQVLAIIERQKQDNEVLLRALATGEFRMTELAMLTVQT